jgi:phosphomannomutase
MENIHHDGSLASHLSYEPQELKFGTSGRRGEIVHLTQLEVYINASAELRYLLTLSQSDGGIVKGDEFYFACDLRPSSSAYVPTQGGRGGIAQAVELAIRDAGMRPVYCGLIPTPALMNFALLRRRGSIMITGSHIPFDRNGYKTNTSRGELMKEHERPIGNVVQEVRSQLYQQPFGESHFNQQGLLKRGHTSLPPESAAASEEYIQRYLSFFGGQLPRDSGLAGKRLVVYQHSAVGRDLLVDVLCGLGAEVIPAGRSNEFVPIDTENIDEAQLAVLQALAAEAIADNGPVDAVVSIDGDSDRPLVLGVDRASGAVKFFGGDLVGMVTAEYLGAGAVVVPISCNDGIDLGKLASVTEPKTRIGSPFVIAGMEAARAKGLKTICGWEANGGFLTGSDIERNGRVLKALPTRDAFLPILCTLFSAQEKGLTLQELFAQLPARFSRAALLRQFPRPVGLAIVEGFSPLDSKISNVTFEAGDTKTLNSSGALYAASDSELTRLTHIRTELESFFNRKLGFAPVSRLNYTDGVRISFENGEVAHIRPSGNADELRIYAVADTPSRADEITCLGIATPGGILRSIESSLTK